MNAFKPEVAQAVSDKLNQALADYHMYYMNLRGFHWNIQGPQFFTLHERFEEYYTTAAEFIDLIAERILALGHRPLHTYADYLERSQLKAHQNVTDGTQAVEALLAQTVELIHVLRAARDTAGDMGDQGTEDIMIAHLQELEKRSWMLSAYLREVEALSQN